MIHQGEHFVGATGLELVRTKTNIGISTVMNSSYNSWIILCYFNAHSDNADLLIEFEDFFQKSG
jgi:hypothetical protein